ncbi:TIGR02687 family protein [Bacillus cereus]|nr:TIGR02687 family protein [Bacillus cereus]PGP77248.1 TIGR02687 family protein [Bacillus cereus]
MYIDTQIERLKQLIQQEKQQKERAVIFWIDPEGEWNEQTLSHVVGDLSEVRIVTPTNFLKIKQEVERQKLTKSFILYSSEKLTSNDLEPLTSLQLAGATFTHDDTIALAEQLHTDEWSLRQLQQEYPKFFKTQTRVQRLERLMKQYPKTPLSGLSLISVITGSEPTVIVNLLNILTHGTNHEENKHIQTIHKFGLLPLFKDLLQNELGVNKLEEETLLTQSITVILTSVYLRDGGVLTEELTPYASNKKNQLATLYEQFIQSPRTQDQWQQWTSEFITSSKIESAIADFSLKQLSNFKWFSVVDELILQKITEEIRGQKETVVFNPWFPIITQRIQNELINYVPHLKRKYQFWLLYFELKTLLKELKEELIIPAENSDELYELYVSNGYKLDELFRNLSVLSEDISRDIYHELFQQLQVEYERDWLEKLANQASTLVNQSKQKEMKPHQTNFYETYVQGYAQKARQFVIISDAFRYEAGKELVSKLQFHPSCTVKCDAMLSSTPTYTQLGMASLLPQIGLLTIKDNGTILLGDMNTSGLENRQKILQKKNPNSVAFKLMDFTKLLTRERKEKIKGKNVVYLYHDTIDAIGDKAVTESKTYKATIDAINELEQAVDMLLSLEAKRIVITADHGYMFVSDTAKSHMKVINDVQESLEGNTRFKMMKQDRYDESKFQYGAFRLPVKQGNVIGTESLIAEGLNRFKKGAGTRFFHGGVSPQERIVPVIIFEARPEVEKVEISIIDSSWKITDYNPKFLAYQSVLASEQHLPRTVRFTLYQGTQIVSNQVLFEFNALKKTDQQQVIPLYLFEQEYPLHSTVTLVLEVPSVKGKWERYRSYDYQMSIL